jgi:predicted aconitase with swiveling domain
MEAADAAYRTARAAEGGGTDPCPVVGVAGQSDPLAVKCLHARVAAALAGTGDPVGEGVLASISERGLPLSCAECACRPVVTSD